MTATFPLSLSEFALLLPVKNFAWKLDDQQELGGLANGGIVGVDVAPRFWRARVALDSMSHQEAAEIQAIIETLDGVLNTFYFHDPRKHYPAYDPKGLILGTNVVQIADVKANNKELKFKGLPPAYQIRRGDMFHRDFGSDPVHRGLHRVSTDSVVADGSGNTGWIEFRPHLYPGAAVNDVIMLKRPAALCRMVPKSLNEGQPAGARNYGMAFEIRQEL